MGKSSQRLTRLRAEIIGLQQATSRTVRVVRNLETWVTKHSVFNMNIFVANARKSWVVAEKAIVIEVAAVLNSTTDMPPEV
jgi:hypothetical protein